MLDRDLIHQKMREHYEKVWQQGDAWDLESSKFEQDRYAAQIAMLGGVRFKSVFEIGCGSGQFTNLIAQVADRVLAIDISSTAVQRAERYLDANRKTNVVVRTADILQFELSTAAPWDLIVMSEVIYCLGWLYPMFDVAWFANTMFEQTENGGRLLLANTLGKEHDWLMRPWLIHTYRDMFLNIGYELEREERFCGVKHEINFEVLMSLLVKR